MLAANKLFGWTWQGLAIGVPLAAAKEFLYDMHFEAPEVSGGWVGGDEDFCAYLVGMLIGFAVVFW